MKTIWKIAKTELLTLFCSPVAWLVLFIFAVQSNMYFEGLISKQLEYKALYGSEGIYGATNSLFTDSMRGLFVNVLGYLYLYLPLLTMGLMSREKKSGSIKLLFSSPVSNTKIILGKYLSIAIYCLALLGVLIVAVLYSGALVVNFDWGWIITALLGIYLLICTYAAIGLFFSSLTSYQVVAAMGTIAFLAILNGIGEFGQDIAFVRDLTYWMSLSGRVYDYIGGILCTEDVLYFIIIIAAFVSLSIIMLESAMKNYSIKRNFIVYTSVIVAVIICGYISSRPAFKGYIDSTYHNKNTLTKESQKVINKLDKDLKITTYVNLLGSNYYSGSPKAFNKDKDRFEKYLRFKTNIKMDYVYYYDHTNNPYLFGRYPNLTLDSLAKRTAYVRDVDFELFKSPKEIAKIIDLKPEGNQFVRKLQYDGKEVMLRLYNDNMKHPSETEITAAIKRFVVKSPQIGFLTGHGERRINRSRDTDYSGWVNNKSFRHSLLNQGLDGRALDLTKIDNIPKEISLIIIADPKKPFTEKDNKILGEYIARGGNMIIAGEPKRRDILNPFIEQFGVKMGKGQVVQKIQDGIPNIVRGNITSKANKFSYRLANLARFGYCNVMPSVAPLLFDESKGYKATAWFTSDKENSWVEYETKDFKEEECILNTKVGEKETVSDLALALTKQVNGKEQRLMILGDADCLSNLVITTPSGQINGGANQSVLPCYFEWITYGEYPINTQRAKNIDTDLTVAGGRAWIMFSKFLFLWLIPGFLLFMGGFTLFRRKRR